MRPRGKAGKVGNPTSAEEERLVGGGGAVGTRKKGFGVRAWLVIDAEGCADVMEAGKHVIMRRTGLPARDLRILDPLLSYPSTILGREHAIVVNLEHIKAIVTAREVLLLNSKDPSVSPLVLELQRRLPNFYNEFGQPPPPPTHQQLAGFGEGCFGDLERDVYNNKPTSGSSPPAVLRKRFESQSQQPKNEVPKMPKPPVESDLNVSETKMGLKDLPFEFRALEVCLESACRCLDSETTILEQEAYPALDELTSKISTLNLERVRQIKSRLVAISGRVQKVRDELEHLLDDDGDMAEMYLSDKLARQQQDGLQYPLSANGSPTNTPRPEMHHMGADGMEREGRPLNGYDSEKSNSHSSSDSSSRSSDSQQLDVAELEMLLEAYFVQIDGTLNKLSTLREYVDDTEDYINIMLDDKQNHLLQMGVMMTTATLVISGSVVVTGLFGMNIHIDLFDKGTLPQFLWTVLGSITASILVYILVIGWCKWKRLLE